MDKNLFYKERRKGAPKGILNVILVLLLVGLVFLAREGLVRFFQSTVYIWNKYYNYFITGVTVTVGMSLIAVIIGSILGTILYFMRTSKIIVISSLAKGFVEIIRGTPLLTQLFIFFFGFGSMIDFKTIGIPIGQFALIAGVVAVSINSGAYVSEIIRSGIQSIGKGQMEAGRSLGMSYGMTMKEIILPQAIKNILPTLGNEFITLIKETSIVSTIGATDIMYNVNLVRGNSFKSMEPLIIAAVLYFVMTFTLSKLMGVLERRLKESD